MQGLQRNPALAVFMAMIVALTAALTLSAATASAAESSAKQTGKKQNGKKKGDRGKKKPKLKKAPKANAQATFTARGSVGDAYVKDAEPGIKLMLVNKQNRIVSEGTADSFGSKVFYDQKMGPGYSVYSRKGNKVAKTKRFEILKVGQNPPQTFYQGKPLHEGLNYVTMRDGIELAMTVRLPQGKDLEDGPFPTFIEHSGYQTAAPHDLMNSVIGGGEPDPLAPATSTAVGALVGPLLEFATVSVQMRGSGCSGGAYDLFGLPTTYDGYDMVETVAAQPWVKSGKVGMAGISYSGISQLFAAGTQPPHLAAIAPMSVTDDVYAGTGYPGGVFNKGFALTWILDRMEDARPAPEGGQEWAKVMTTTGDPLSATPGPDQHCIDNQDMRLQTRNAVKLVEKHAHRTPKIFKYRAPGYWMDKIDVPVFLIGSFQDEQTGGHFPESLAKLADNEDVWISMQNGVHVDSLGPSTITRWAEFMNLFVADRIPEVPSLILALSGELYRYLADANALPVEQSRFADYEPSQVDQAREEFRQDPRVRLLMDNGAAIPGEPGSIGAAWEMTYDTWPVEQADPVRMYLGSGGKLTGSKPGKARATYTADPSARPPQTLVGAGESDAWKAQPPYNWAPLAAGKGLGWTGSAFAADTVIAGPSSLDLYLKSSARDTDLQVTLSEVRPDGKETYVQNGFLRASHRKLDKKLSTVDDPVPTHLKKDAAPLPKRKFSLVRVPIFPVAHAFRAGSKLRVTVQALGGDRPIWDFATLDKGKAKNTVSFGGRLASRLVLPVVEGATAQGTPLPEPTALRGMPSRDYTPGSNGG